MNKGGKPAMTLVEVVVSLSLAAALLAALTGVLNGIRTQQKLALGFEVEDWPFLLEELLRRDLAAAESVWSTQSTFYLTTNSPNYGIENEGSPRRPAGLRRVAYRCVELSEGFFVLQRVDPNGARTISLNCPGLVVERVDGRGVSQPLPPIPGPVPERIRFWTEDHKSFRIIDPIDVVYR